MSGGDGSLLTTYWYTSLGSGQMPRVKFQSFPLCPLHPSPRPLELVTRVSLGSSLGQVFLPHAASSA